MPVERPPDVPAFLMALRADAGLSQSRLAALLGVSFATVGRWERGRSRPSERVWQRFAALDVRPSAPRQPSGGPTQPSLARSAGLPAALSSFVGRIDAIARLNGALAQSRLVTLTGPGGVGKTRLAIEAICTRQDEAAGELAFVDLTPLRNASLIAATLAVAMGVQEEAGRTLAESIARALAERQSLLLLDNCEHLVDGCGRLVARLLAACPGLRVLATSRERLNIDGEAVYELAPLALPIEQASSVEELDAAEASALFLGRARARQANFRLEDDAVGAVAQICRRLDGLPLAIELAAARTGTLSPRQIATRLDDRFRLLVGGRRDAPARHQTLRATLDWSYDLLTPAERSAFRQMSVFPGDFDLDAAEAVCATDGVPSGAALELVSRLIDTSLLESVEHEAGRRYRFLETLRAYGRERLTECGEAEAALRRHADHYGALAGDATSIDAPGAPLSPSWAATVVREYANLQAALTFLHEQGAAEAYFLLAATLQRFWLDRGRYSEGRQVLERGLPLLDRAPTRLQARALNGLGSFAQRQSDEIAAQAWLAESLALERELGDTAAEANTLNSLGMVQFQLGDTAAAHADLAEGLALITRLPESNLHLQLIGNLGLVAHGSGEYTVARAHYQQALALSGRLSYSAARAVVLTNFGALAYDERNLDSAEIFLAEALQLADTLRYTLGATLIRCAQGLVARDRGDGAAARGLLCAALQQFHELGSRADLARTLVCLALVEVDAGRPQHAARCFGAAHSLAERIMRVPWRLLDEQRRAEAAAVAALGEVAFQALWRVGAALSQNEAVTQALASDPDTSDRGSASAVARDATFVAGAPPLLTEREREVLRLLVGGSSNKEIAAALVLSVRTVERHIENIYAKTGARGRAAVTEHALRRQLL